MDGGKTTANWITINNGQFSQGTYIKGTLKTDTANITTATISNGKVTGDFTIDGVLSSNEWVKNIVKAVGGQQYICPTFEATGTTSISCTAATATDVSFTISDSTAITGLTYGGANWNQNSKVMLSGNIQGNKSGAPEIVFSSAQGTVTANMNSTSGKLQIKISYPNANSYFQSGAVTFTNVSVMMYQIMVSGTLYPIGIYLKAYGNDNKNSYIDIYGGTSTTPNARLGLLNGLAAMANGTTPTGWGIATTNGFFDGTIVSNSGTIGGWTIGSTSLSNNTLGTDGSMWLTTADVTAVKFAGAASALTTWRIGAGSKFGVTSDGTCYCSNIQATGGKIGSWNLTNNLLYYGGTYSSANNIFSPTDTSFLLAPSGAMVSIQWPTDTALASNNYKLLVGKYLGVEEDGTTHIKNGTIASFSVTSNMLSGSLRHAGQSTENVYTNVGLGTHPDKYAFWCSYNNETQFSVAYDGTLNATKLNATGGTIGGWNVTRHAFYSEITDENNIVTQVALQNAMLYADLENCEVNSFENGQITITVLEDGDIEMQNLRIMLLQPYTTPSFAIKGTISHTGTGNTGTLYGVALTTKNGVETADGLYAQTGVGTYGFAAPYSTPYPDNTIGARLSYDATGCKKGDTFTITFKMYEDPNWQHEVALDWSVVDFKLPVGTVMGIKKGTSMIYSLASNGFVKARNLLIEHPTYAQTIVKNASREGRFQVNADNNLGIYDRTNGAWMIRSDPSNQKVYIPHNLSVTGTLETTGNITETKTSGDISIGGNNGTRNGKFLINSSGTLGLYDNTNSKWIIYSPTNLGVNIPQNLSITGTLNVSSTIDSSNITVTTSSSAAARVGIKCTSVREGRLQINTDGNFGIYDVTNSGWIIRSASDQSVYVPQKLLCQNYYDTTSRPVVCGVDTNGKKTHRIESTSSGFTMYGQFGSTSATSSKNFAASGSDIRLKTNVTNTEITDALSTIDKIQMRAFDWRDNDLGHQKIGFIADELDQIDKKFSIGGGYDEDGNMNIKSVDTFYLQGYEVKAIQELHKLIKDQAIEIQELKAKIKELKGM